MEEFDVSKYVSDPMAHYTTYDVMKVLNGKVMQMCLKTNANAIVTNGNIGSFLQDSHFYTVNPIRLMNELHFYPLGSIGEKILYIDSHMRWGDNRVLFYNQERSEEIVERKYSEEDPYGEENWNDDKDNEFNGVLLDTLFIKDENGILI